MCKDTQRLANKFNYAQRLAKTCKDVKRRVTMCKDTQRLANKFNYLQTDSDKTILHYS